MKLQPRTLVLVTALTAALFTLPAFAQTAPEDPDAVVVAEATVPKDRLVDRYTGVDGLTEAESSALISNLRTGGDFTVEQQKLEPVKDAAGAYVLNADGTVKLQPAFTTVTNADGTTTQVAVMETVTVVNPNGPMGWGEVNISMSLAKALVEGGEASSLESALSGGTTTTYTVDANGNLVATTTTTTAGVLQMRADGMGWGKIAKELGFKNLGSLIAAGNKSDKARSGEEAAAKGKAERTAKADRAAKAGKPEHTGKPDRVAKVDRPEKLDRPSKPERPERPSKPERSGRP